MTTYRFRFYDSLGDSRQFVEVRESSLAVAVAITKKRTDLPFWLLVAREDRSR